MATLNLVKVTVTTSGDSYVQSCADTPETIEGCVEFLMGCAFHKGETLKGITFEPETIEVEDDEDDAPIYSACNDCAAHIINGLDGADPDFTAVSDIESFLNDHGVMAVRETINPDGYWLCDVCGLDQMGEGVVLVQV